MSPSNPLGLFAVQTMLHSLVALVLFEGAVRISKTADHLTRLRYRTTVVAAPPFLFLFFQLISPDRNGFFFRQDMALFDSLQWLNARLVFDLPLGKVFFWFTVIATTGLALFQEIIPMIRTAGTSADAAPVCSVRPHVAETVRNLSGRLGIDPPPLRAIDDDTPLILTTGTRSHTVALSRGLLDVLSPAELETALAHELAHIRRHSAATTFLVFVLRLMTFFNPVSLLLFRRIVQDEEHICDDITVSLTGKGPELARALRIFLHHGVGKEPGTTGIITTVETHGHDLRLQERIDRLENVRDTEDGPFSWFRFSLVSITVALFCYFTV